MFCTNCGGILPPTAKFCGGCGTKVDIASASKSATSTRLFDAPSTSVHRQTKSIERVGDPNSIKPDAEVRCLFVIGAEQTYEAESWLNKCFPNSTVKRFTTKNEIRDLVLKLASEGVVDCLCLIGKAETVPPFRIIKDYGVLTSEPELEAKYEVVESDILYCSKYNYEEMLPGFGKDVSNHRRSLFKLGIEEAIGVIPVGRLPYDDFRLCKEYLTYLNAEYPCISHDLLTITHKETSDWYEECLWVKEQLVKQGEFLTLPVGYSSEYDNPFYGRFEPGAYVQINLHGSPYKEIKEDQIRKIPRQEFSGLTSDGEYQWIAFDRSTSPKNIIWLYACYGGNSAWWNNGFIFNSLTQGAYAVVASSDTSYTSGCKRDHGHIIMPPGSPEICSKFFKYIDVGMCFGEALTLAKAETLGNSVDYFHDPSNLVATLKEVCQFSLYGAPWFSPNKPKGFSSTSNNPPKRSVSLLESIRSGQRKSAAMDGKTNMLSHLRESLHKSLGNGAEFFTLSRQSALDAYRNSGTLDRITANIRSQGYEFEKSRFESVHLLGQDFQIAYAPSADKESTSHLMVVLGNSGEVINTYQSKG